ncbi:hypothetical protein, partial [Escherichia coli]|uniref:hypothetical protein n=1 Tax=Escherichia coli TaxID=562 RepID=UPI001BB476D3
SFTSNECFINFTFRCQIISNIWGAVQNALSGIHNQYVVCRPDKRCASGIIALTLLLRINLSAHPAKFSLPHRIAQPGWYGLR